MTRRLFLVIGAVALGALLLSRASRPSRLRIGRQAPPFRLAGLAGQTVSLSDYRGKLVLLNFWASWCPDCRDEFLLLEDFQRRFRSRGLEVVAPSIDAADRKAVTSFLARLSPSFTVLLANPNTAQDYSVRALPSSFLIGPDGSIVRRYIGRLKPRQLENDILTALPRRPS